MDRVVTPCMGVWIETPSTFRRKPKTLVTPCMGVWIETGVGGCSTLVEKSHPVWVCGLKLNRIGRFLIEGLSHPVWVCGLKQF